MADFLFVFSGTDVNVKNGSLVKETSFHNFTLHKYFDRTRNTRIKCIYEGAYRKIQN